MTEQTDTPQPTCPWCKHAGHHPGTECEAGVEHGPKRWHRCLCLNLVGADSACPPQMDCQGGTLGYSDAWHAQRQATARTAAARQTAGQDDIGPTCAHCQGTGADPEDQGDYDPNVHMYNPTTIGPCPECHGTGKDAPAVGQPAEAHDTDRAAVLAEAIEAAEGELLHDDTGSSDDEAYNRGVHDAVVAIKRLTVEDER